MSAISGPTTATPNLTVGDTPTTSIIASVTANGFIVSKALNTVIGAENTSASGSGAGAIVALYSNDGAAMASGDRLGGFLFGGSSSASALRNAVLIAGFASEAWVDATGYGSELRFETTKNGTTTRVLRMTIGNNGNIIFPTTITPGGTTGAQTIDKPTGTVNIAAGNSSVVVTNNMVTANSIVFAVLRTNDATAAIKNVVPGAGSFTINLTANATAEVSIGFFVVN